MVFGVLGEERLISRCPFALTQVSKMEQKIPAEDWVTAYSRSIQDLPTVWNFTQEGDMLLFDDAFDWVKPKTLTKPEHIEKYLQHLNERVSSFVAEDGFIYITVQWKSGQMTYDPIYFRFRYADLNPDEDFFVLAQDKWNNIHIAVNAVGMDTWKVQKDRYPKRIKDKEVNPRVEEIMNKMMQGQTVSSAELQHLQRHKHTGRGEYYSAWVSKWIDEDKAKYTSNLSKYYRQPKHRAGLSIFKPSEAKVQQKVRVGLFNWDYLSI